MLYQLYKSELLRREWADAISYCFTSRPNARSIINFITNIDPFDTPWVISHPKTHLHSWVKDDLYGIDEEY